MAAWDGGVNESFESLGGGTKTPVLHLRSSACSRC